MIILVLVADTVAVVYNPHEVMYVSESFYSLIYILVSPQQRLKNLVCKYHGKGQF